MKKRLLTLGMLALAMGINAQTSATYVKDAKFFVSNGTLSI